MVRHLHRKVRRLDKNFSIDVGAVVVDIGSNDGTLLNAYHSQNIRGSGLDPAATSRRRAILGADWGARVNRASGDTRLASSLTTTREI